MSTSKRHRNNESPINPIHISAGDQWLQRLLKDTTSPEWRLLATFGRSKSAKCFKNRSIALTSHIRYACYCASFPYCALFPFCELFIFIIIRGLAVIRRAERPQYLFSSSYYPVRQPVKAVIYSTQLGI